MVLKSENYNFHRLDLTLQVGFIVSMRGSDMDFSATSIRDF